MRGGENSSVPQVKVVRDVSCRAHSGGLRIAQATLLGALKRRVLGQDCDGRATMESNRVLVWSTVCASKRFEDACGPSGPPFLVTGLYDILVA